MQHGHGGVSCRRLRFVPGPGPAFRHWHVFFSCEPVIPWQVLSLQDLRRSFILERPAQIIIVYLPVAECPAHSGRGPRGMRAAAPLSRLLKPRCYKATHWQADRRTFGVTSPSHRRQGAASAAPRHRPHDSELPGSPALHPGCHCYPALMTRTGPGPAWQSHWHWNQQTSSWQRRPEPECTQCSATDRHSSEVLSWPPGGETRRARPGRGRDLLLGLASLSLSLKTQPRLTCDGPDLAISVPALARDS